MSSPYLISRQALIKAPPAAVFELVARPAAHSLLDGSGTVLAQQPNGPERLGPGARFGMEMKLGVSYRILNTVVEFEEGRRLAWRHFFGHVWRYVLEPRGDGTLVTEQWDARAVRGRVLLRLAGFPRRNAAGIERTLQNLADRFAEQETA